MHHQHRTRLAALVLAALIASGCAVATEKSIVLSEPPTNDAVSNTLPPAAADPDAPPAEPTSEQAVDPAAPNPFDGRIVLAAQLNDNLPGLLGATENLSADISRLVPFPEIVTPNDAVITDIQVTIYGEGFNDDPAQTRVFVEYTTGAGAGTAYTTAVESLRDLGTFTVDDAGVGQAVVTPNDENAFEYSVTVSSGSPTTVRIGAITADIDSAELARFSEWHDYETPLNVTTDVLITNIRATEISDTEVGTFYETGWVPFGTVEDMNEDLLKELSANRWFYFETDQGWTVTEPVEAEFELSTTLFTYAREFRLRAQG